MVAIKKKEKALIIVFALFVGGVVLLWASRCVCHAGMECDDAVRRMFVVLPVCMYVVGSALFFVK